jgi:hypothetical protein
MNTATNSHIMFNHVHVLYVTTVGLFYECEHAVNLVMGVAIAWLGMNTARIALQTARMNRAVAQLSEPDAATDPMQAFTKSLSRPRTAAKLLSRPWPNPNHTI